MQLLSLALVHLGTHAQLPVAAVVHQWCRHSTETVHPCRQQTGQGGAAMLDVAVLLGKRDGEAHGLLARQLAATLLAAGIAKCGPASCSTGSMRYRLLLTEVKGGQRQPHFLLTDKGGRKACPTARKHVDLAVLQP